MAGETSSKKQMFGQNLEVSTCKQQVQVEMIVGWSSRIPRQGGIPNVRANCFPTVYKSWLQSKCPIVEYISDQIPPMAKSSESNSHCTISPGFPMFYNGFCLSKFDHIPQHLDAVLLLSALRFRGAAGHELSASGTDPIPQHYITWLKFFVKWDGGGNFDFFALSSHRLEKNKRGVLDADGFHDAEIQNHAASSLRLGYTCDPSYAQSACCMSFSLPGCAGMAMMVAMHPGLLHWTSPR